MATRSAIGIAHGDRIKGIYCHYDGAPDYNGRILRQFYTDSVTVNKLISMGDASALGAAIGEQRDFDAKVSWVAVDGIEVADQCRFYGRDRDEATSWLSSESPAEFVREFAHAGAEYFYLFRNDRWFVKGRQGPWRRLDRVLAAE